MMRHFLGFAYMGSLTIVCAYTHPDDLDTPQIGRLHIPTHSQ